MGRGASQREKPGLFGGRLIVDCSTNRLPLYGGGCMVTRMSEVIDRVETAIFEAVGYSIPLEICRDAAVAALKAMREPTPQMKAAGIEAIADAEMTVQQWLNYSADDLGPAFDAMIDAALTP